jgi:hypothetical protein
LLADGFTDPHICSRARFRLRADSVPEETSQDMLFELMPQRAFTGDKDSDEWNQLRSLAVVAGVPAIWDIQRADGARRILTVGVCAFVQI